MGINRSSRLGPQGLWMVRNNGEELYMCFMYKVKAIITEISIENEIIRNKKKN